MVTLYNRVSSSAANAYAHLGSVIRSSWLGRTVSRWQELENFQKLYLIAAIVFLLSYTELAILIAIVALLIDFWPRFTGVWETLAGKALTLILYAVTTNFALVSAAGMVNDVTGIEAKYFPYAHYTAVLLSLPGWILGISIATLVLSQLFFPLYLLGKFVLRSIGIYKGRIFTVAHHPVITLFLRFALSWLVVIQVEKFINHEDDSTPNKEENASIQQAPGNKPGQDSDDSNTVNLMISGEEILRDGSYNDKIRGLLAHFIYHFEANANSRCELEANTRSVDLNHYQHVAIVKDEAQPDGYLFTVKACKSPGIPGQD